MNRAPCPTCSKRTVQTSSDIRRGMEYRKCKGCGATWRVSDAGEWFAYVTFAERRRLRAVADRRRVMNHANLQSMPLRSIPAIRSGLNLWPVLTEGENSAVFKFCEMMR